MEALTQKLTHIQETLQLQCPHQLRTRLRWLRRAENMIEDGDIITQFRVRRLLHHTEARLHVVEVEIECVSSFTTIQ